ncbi:MAG: hypothetical protein ACF8PN_00535 [Phycisphaerales bacterium]
MRWFAIGFTIPFAALVGVTIWREMLLDALTTDYAIWVADGMYDRLDIGVMLVLLGVAPPLTAITAASLVHLVCPLRMCDRRRPGVATRVGAGALAGLVVIALTVVGLALAHEQVPDWLILITAATTGTVAVLIFCPRLRRGHCLVCDYDLHACVGTNRCPECGAIASMG